MEKHILTLVSAVKRSFISFLCLVSLPCNAVLTSLFAMSTPALCLSSNANVSDFLSKPPNTMQYFPSHHKDQCSVISTTVLLYVCSVISTTVLLYVCSVISTTVLLYVCSPFQYPRTLQLHVYISVPDDLQRCVNAPSVLYTSGC
jgi:hypothetical protein